MSMELARRCVCSVVLVGLIGAGIGVARADLAGHWSFDEPQPGVAVDSSGKRNDASVVGAAWVDGAFGKALRFTGSNCAVHIPEMAALNGSDELTVSAWVLWEGTGQYPNIISGGQWSPGGFMIFVNNDACSFRMGRPGHKAGRPGDEWQEVSAPFLNPIPRGRWVHLAATFKRPEIVTYVDGKKVGSATWNYPVGHSGDVVVGRWQGSASHNGLIDDVKIWTHALSADEVLGEWTNSAKGRAPVAGKPAYRAASVPPAPTVLTLETTSASLQIDARGRIAELAEKGSGRALITGPSPLATLELGHKSIPAQSCRLEDGKLVLTFLRNAGVAVLKAAARGPYFRFEIESVTGEGATGLTFCRLPVSVHDYVGHMACHAADDRSGVCMRALNLATRVRISGRPPVFSARCTETYGIVGGAVAIAAGPTGTVREALKAVAQAEDVPKSTLGGPYAMDAEDLRGSYLFSNVSETNVDDWIDIARRGGFTHVHFNQCWSKNLGHYDPNPHFFPNGLAGMKTAVAKIHAAGLKAGMHTLTGCISTDDPWVTPVPDKRLVPDASYTLTSAMTVDADAIYVDEPPGKHDIVWSYSGNGNVIRIEEELIHYHALSREKPYGFLKCKRGAFGTKPAPHPAGAAADHLQQRYLAFYPEEGSTLVGEVADAIATVCNTTRMDLLYQDGSEGMRGWHQVAVMRTAIFERLDHPVLIEASCHGHHNWWFHSRLGAWDHPKWGVKRWTDMHRQTSERYRKGDLLEPHMGWWAFIGPSRISRGLFPDEIEYFALKSMAFDSSMSVQGVQVGQRPPNARQDEYFTLQGWYERLRLARYFSDEVIARIGKPREEFRLRQGDDGHWYFRPAEFAKHKVTGESDGSRSWQVENRFRAQPARLRVEALYAAAPYQCSDAVTVAEFADPASFPQQRAASGVIVKAGAAAEKPPCGGAALEITATNRGGRARNESWAMVGRQFEPYLNVEPGQALGLWVRGDGKGAVLNVQVLCPREHHHCIAEHYVDLNFTGWRYIELPFRERDASRYHDYTWPYFSQHGIFRNPIQAKHVSGLNLYLNGLPAGDTVNVAIGTIKALPVRRVELTRPTVTVNGTACRLPVSLASGQYVELGSGGDGLHYDERGELLERFQLPERPSLNAGANQLGFSCPTPAGFSARADVTVISLGEPFGERAPDDTIDWARLNREYELPRTITALDGKSNSWQIPARPGAAPTLEVDLLAAQVGGQYAAYQSPGAVLLDACDDPSRFESSSNNTYAKYAYDAQSKGIPAKPGVTQQMALEKDLTKVGGAALRYTADSTRDDRGGWSAKGRRFDPPLDMSACLGLGFWLHGDGKGESFKVQFRDTAGKWHDMVTRVDFAGWRYVEFSFDKPNLDLSKIEYLILFYNSIPAGSTVSCVVDDLRGLKETGSLPHPAIVVGEQTLTFPVDLCQGQRLMYRGGETFRVLSAAGQLVAERRIEGVAPRFKAGLNLVTLKLADGAPPRFRLRADVVKVYP